MSFTPLFRVVGGLDTALPNSKSSLAEARRHARPVLKRWLQRVEHHIVSGQLAPLDYLLAKELTNYPSANEGRCYAGQTRLGAAVGSCTRTARSSLKRMCSVGLLARKRGGPGRTASWTFCINGEPIFGGAERKVAALDRQQVADKPSEPDPIEHKPPPYPPTPSALDEGGLSGEVLPPETEATFDNFVKSIRHAPGRLGPALAIWNNLTLDDRRAIGNLLGPRGIDLDGMHASVWLKARRWECAPLTSRRSADEIAEALAAMPRHHIVDLKPYSAEWTAERKRKVAVGEPVELMDTWALVGRCWSVRAYFGGMPQVAQ